MIPKYLDGPAFPQDRVDMYGTRTTEGGMSMRDWFATHAPETPKWFKHEPSEPYPFIPEGADEVTSERLRVKRAAWIARQRLEKFIRWRWFYADMMLAARND